MDDAYFMGLALQEAHKAFDAGEVPVGAVIVMNNRILARAHNLTERLNDVTAHAEMQAFTAASEALGGKYLKNCTLYVTLEPCVMCAGASFWAQIDRLVFGADDPDRGFRNIRNNKILHPKTSVTGGVRAIECGELLSSFFKRRRDR